MLEWGIGISLLLGVVGHLSVGETALALPLNLGLAWTDYYL